MLLMRNCSRHWISSFGTFFSSKFANALSFICIYIYVAYLLLTHCYRCSLIAKFWYIKAKIGEIAHIISYCNIKED